MRNLDWNINPIAAYFIVHASGQNQIIGDGKNMGIALGRSPLSPVTQIPVNLIWMHHK